jgi:predicted ATPase
MGDHPSGTVTFLITDIEGSTRRWEAEPDSMRAALAEHDDVLRSAIESRGGWLFKHTGDGVCAAFASAPDAVTAAVDAQRRLSLPVRMGVGTGSAELRAGDYFGPAVSRAARVMAAGHGGQILVAASTAAVVDGVELIDLGEHRLRDLSGVHRIFQVRAVGLSEIFPPLRTLDTVPGNLPLQTTSFIGRAAEIDDLVAVVRTERLVTLIGVGGVGKTRLALQVAGEVLPEFPDGVWLVELAPVGDPGAVGDAVATALGITPQSGLSTIDSVAGGVAARRLLLVLDNCEHVLDAVAGLVEAVLARSESVKIIVTSREGLRVGAEHVWLVPPLGVGRGTDSAAIALFVERARAATTGFASLSDDDATAVAEICRRLDGIALAIELAAARMVSMSLADLRERLDDRFRLLSGGRRGLERHQTLRHAVQWSYELLGDAERDLLIRCSVFAGGFDLRAASCVCGYQDDYETLDLLDSLVRKSLLTVERGAGGHARYGMLETIRQFAEDQLAGSAALEKIRDGHAQYFAAQSEVMFGVWLSPQQGEAFHWVEDELANLRSSFRWIVDRGDHELAAMLASRVALLSYYIQSFEPIGWAEELLGTGAIDERRSLTWLHVAASLCLLLGRADDAVRHGEAAVAFFEDPRSDPILNELVVTRLAWAHLFGGRPEMFVQLCRDLAPADPMATARTGIVWGLATMGHYDDAREHAADALTAAEATGIPFPVLYGLDAYAKAYADIEPGRALAAKRRALTIARESNNRLWSGVIARELAGLEAAHGDPRAGLDLFDATIESFHRSMQPGNLAATLGQLVAFFALCGRERVAATLFGAISSYVSAHALVAGLTDIADQTRQVLGPETFEHAVRDGAAMTLADAVTFAQVELQQIRLELNA